MSVVLLGSTSGSITLQEPAVAGTNTVNFGANTGVAILDANTPAFRNRILNGGMVIDQRNAGASVTADGSFPVDRWKIVLGGGGALTAQRSTTAPNNFVNSLLFTVTTPDTSLGTSDEYSFRHAIEGFNVSDLGWGTASAQPITLSFKVRSSLTGTFGGVIRNSASNRIYVFSYTITTANTFEDKSITIAGDTSGTWLTDSGIGLQLIFSLGAGSARVATAGSWGTDGAVQGVTGQTQWIGTNGATFYITGVQLEKGSTATSFDYRPYGTELALCQRYYYKVVASSGSSGFATGYASQTTVADGIVVFPTTMRTPPTALETTGTAANYRVRFLNSAANCSSVPTFFIADVDSSHVRFPVSSGLTAGDGIVLTANAIGAYLGWSAEL